VERAEVDPRVVDAVIGAAVAVTVAVIVAAAGATDPLAYLFALLFGALVLFRRRRPRTVLALTVLGEFTYYAVDLPPVGVAVPVVAALWSAAQQGALRWAIGAGVVLFTVSTVFRWREVSEPATVLGYQSFAELALIAGSVALGDSVRARRLAEERRAEVVRLTAERVAEESAARVAAERQAISRDLHDSVGHTLTVVALHAGVAADAVDPGNRTAQEALSRIRGASADTLADLRRMVRVLRATPEPGVLDLRGISDLAEAGRRDGLDVALRSVAAQNVPASVQAAAYRVVQEALTNVVRHSANRRVVVTLEHRQDGLMVAVEDHGTPPVESGEGFGLLGLRERVMLLGGEFTACPVADGFVVWVLLPVDRAAS